MLERTELPGGLVREKLRLPGFDPDESVPAIAIFPATGGPFPVAICLHYFRGAKENFEGWCRDLAAQGIFGIAIDAHLHGERSIAGLFHGDNLPSLGRLVNDLEPLYGQHRDRLRFLPFPEAGHEVTATMWKEAQQWIVRGLEATSRSAASGTSLAGVSESAKAETRSGGTNLVWLKGHSLCDDRGPFLALGVSYFQALRHAKYDRGRLNDNLALFAAKGFNYVRILSMVSWDELEIAPVTFTNRAGRVVQGWPDYWQQFRDLLDLVGEHGLRAEVTIFADAQYVMPSQATRQTHLDGVLANIAGREARLLHLEVANEAWQNGFPGAQGIGDLRAFTRHLAEHTRVPVAITSNDDTSEEGIISLHRGSAADLATVHFSRDTRTPEGGWLPVRDVYRAGNLRGVPPVSSNEPIGPGSSVGSEDDPIKLCAAAVFAYVANLPAYVYHSRAGVFGYVKCCPPGGGEDRFENSAGINAFQFLRQILPPDLPGWTRNDGLEPGAPFTVFCNGRPNQYWPGVNGPTDGCHRNIGSSKGNEFVCLPMGILGGGVTLEARRPVQFQVYNPLTGVIVSNATVRVGERITLPQGPGAYVLKGRGWRL